MDSQSFPSSYPGESISTSSSLFIMLWPEVDGSDIIDPFAASFAASCFGRSVGRHSWPLVSAFTSIGLRLWFCPVNDGSIKSTIGSLRHVPPSSPQATELPPPISRGLSSRC